GVIAQAILTKRLLPQRFQAAVEVLLHDPGPMRDPILHYIWTNQQPTHMERRQFLVRSCQACAALAFIPAATLTGCASFKGLSLAADNGMVQVPLAQLDPSGKTMVKAKGAP